MCLSQQAFFKEKKKSMHKWIISIKVLRAVWKINTLVYSQGYQRRTAINFQLIMDNIPVVVSNYCLKKKKKIQELISDSERLQSVFPAKARLEKQPKANLDCGFSSRKKSFSTAGRRCERPHTLTHTRTHAHTHIFRFTRQLGLRPLFQKFVSDQKH